MFVGLFSIIQLILRAIGLWDQFLNWSDKKRLADAEANTEARNKAVDEQKKAADEDAFNKAQDDISRHNPG